MGKKLLFILSASLLMTGCFKDSVHNDANSTAVVGIYRGGQNNLANAPLSLATPDSLIYYMYAGISSGYLPSKDVLLSISTDDAARIAYNQSHSVKYDALPDSLYEILTDSLTLAAGTRSLSFAIRIRSGKADLTKNYMLPIAIRNAQGLPVSADSGIIYLSQIGSPIAGRYKVTGTRTNYIGPKSSGVVETVTDLSTIGNKTTTTNSYTEVKVDYADLGTAGWQYDIEYDPADKTITVQPNDVIISAAAGIQLGSFKVDLQEYSTTTRIIHVITEYVNEAGNARVIDEYLTPQ